MADYRYLEAWRKPSSSSATSARPGAAASAAYDSGPYQDVLVTTRSSEVDPARDSTYQIRLDTPGGITYAPDILHSHNSAKRLFIPPTTIEQRAEYDFAEEIQRQNQAKQADDQKSRQQQQQNNEQQQSPTDAQAYAASIDIAADPQQPADKPAAKEARFASEVDTIPEAPVDSLEREAPGNQADLASLFTTYTATTYRSVSSRMTVMTLAADPDGTLPLAVASNVTVAKTRIPPSIAGDGSDTKPWQSTEWAGHRALDRPSLREKEAGITNFEDVGGYGRVPSTAEAELRPASHDGQSIRTARTAKTVGGLHDLRIADLFVPDPRPWRPLRYVRKVDPRQMLLMCAGTTLTVGQVAANRIGSAQCDAASVRSYATTAVAKAPSAAPSTALTEQSARRSMLNFGKMPDYDSFASQLSSASSSADPSTEEVRGGLGFVFCPSVDPCASATDADRRETNFSRRLERPPELCSTTKKRAGLRSVVAALEYQRWEEEGFDKIVVATHHRWIVDGISRNIWEWRHNDWRLTHDSPLGMPGESVPDRDLWELLEAAVDKYEDIDCTVRFWYVPRTENMQAFHLAEQGAMKDNQQLSTVRWTKPKKKKAAGRGRSV
ncbi:hypothetical protein ACQY0O_000261 [Thecaphora frezii]